MTTARPVSGVGDIPPVTPVQARDLRDLNGLIEDVFLSKGSRANIDLNDVLKQFGDYIARNVINTDVVYSKTKGNYTVTVKGQIPRNPGNGVVLVVDFDKSDGTKFTPEEKAALRAYSFQLHFRNPQSTTALRNVDSKRVALSERGDSMSCGFWPTTFGGPRILTTLVWNYFRPKYEQLKYKSAVLDNPRRANNIVVELNAKELPLD